MCGIFLETKSNLNFNELSDIALRLKHRGPDSQNTYIDGEMQLSVAFARLAIQDLSNNADQPFFSSDGQSYLLFNGEIYNKKQLQKLLPWNFKASTSSDTELLLNCILILGLKNTLNRIQGMFAFVYVDKKNQTIHIARDMFGIKPMYYAQTSDGSYKFCSEIKILKELLSLSVYPDMLREFAICGLIDHSENTMFSQVKKMIPGTILTITNEGCFVESWVEKNIDPYKFDSNLNVLTHLEGFFKNTIEEVLVSDVPVGMTLSTGIDSNLIRVLAQESIPDIQLHVVGWGEDIYSENYELENYLGTNNLIIHEFNSSQVYNLLLESFLIHDEPYTSPFVAVWPQVYRKIKKSGISVVLDGTGADELFFGYTKYILNSFRNYSQNALDGVNVGLNFKSYFDYLPLNVNDANRYDTFEIKLPRSLRFLDAASMSASVEVRPVYLTKALYDLSRNIPIDLMTFNRNTKYPLRWLLQAKESNFPSFAKKKSIQLPKDQWIRHDWRKEVINQVKNIDDILDLISNREERRVLILEKNKYLENDSDANINAIWRLFNIKLWLESI